jgi:hypothetical protein
VNNQKSQDEEFNENGASNMLKYFVQLENGHTVPTGALGHGFNVFLDIMETMIRS